MESQSPLFKFARDYMKFVACFLMFVRATREGGWNLHLESLKALTKYFFAHDRLNYARLVPLYLAQMQKIEVDDPDIYEEFMQGNFCVNKSEIPFCAVGPDHALEHVNKMKIQGGLKGLTQQPAAMTRWFLIAPELSRLAANAESMVGVLKSMPKRHHDLTDAVINLYNQKVGKLKDLLKANEPFQMDGDNVVNIVTKAVMPTAIKEVILKRDEIGQELFDKFVKERIGADHTLSVWSPMKKANLKTCKSARLTKKNNNTESGATALRNER